MSNQSLIYEQNRLRVLQQYKLVELPATEALQNLVEMASLICESPIAFISVVDDKYEWIKAKKGISAEKIPKDITICQHSINTREPLLLTNLKENPEFFKYIPLLKIGAIEGYVGFPILDNNGFALGTLCVMDFKPINLSDNQISLLQILAKQCAIRYTNLINQNTYKSIERLFSISSDLIRVCKKDGTIVSVNPAVYNLLGWTDEEIIGKSLFQFLNPDSLADARNAFSNLSKENSILNITYNTKDKQGNFKTLEWVGTYDVVTDLVYSIGRDITEIEERTKKLLDNERKFRTLFENSPTFMCLHDLEGNFISLNKAGAQKLGYTVEELQNASLFTVIPEDRHPFLKAYLESIKIDGNVNGIMQTITKNKEARQIWIYNNSLFTDSEGYSFVIGNAIDMTERVQMEEELTQTKNMLSQTNHIAKIGGWELNYLKATAYWTEETRRIVEVNEDFIPSINGSIGAYTDEKDKIKIQNAIKNAVEKGIEFDINFKIKTAKGNLLWVRSIGIPEFDDTGRCIRLQGTLQDIDEKEKNAEDLRKAKLLAEQASKAKSEFLANMSHEIRTPLNGIIGFTDLVIKTNLSETQRRYLDIVNESANSLLSIINDILDFSKIEAGKLELVPTVCDLIELASQAVNIISYQAQNKNLKIELNLSPSLPRHILIDDIRLKQILVNLLSNAVKFTEQGSITINIIQKESLDNNIVKLGFEIIDTGIGIHPDKKDKIFKSFEQESAGTAKKYGGTGLGVPISNSLLKMMGSELRLTSEVGVGTKFYFDLEVTSHPEDTIEWDYNDEIKSVLVIDDSDISQKLIKEMLKLKNIETTLAHTGLEALQMLYEGRKFDVILVDYMMPIMDGIETIKKIKENFYPKYDDQAIVILYSAKDEDTLRESCKNLNIDGQLMKPIKMTELYSAFHNLKKKIATEVTNKIEKSSKKEEVKILIAEDNKINMLLSKTLITRNFPQATIYEANNGIEAIDITKEQNPDLILMDIQMPEMGGIEATSIIREELKRNDIKIVALTAGIIKGDKENCLAAGMNDFLPKPIIEKDLIATLQKWLDVDREEEVHVDFSIIENYAQGDAELEKTLLELGKQSLLESLEKIKESITKQNAKNIKIWAHKLKGTSSTAGMLTINKIVKEMEQADYLKETRLQELWLQLEKEAVIVISKIDIKLK